PASTALGSIESMSALSFASAAAMSGCGVIGRLVISFNSATIAASSSTVRRYGLVFGRLAICPSGHGRDAWPASVAGEPGGSAGRLTGPAAEVVWGVRIRG